MWERESKTEPQSVRAAKTLKNPWEKKEVAWENQKTRMQQILVLKFFFVKKLKQLSKKTQVSTEKTNNHKEKRVDKKESETFSAVFNFLSKIFAL